MKIDTSDVCSQLMPNILKKKSLDVSERQGTDFPVQLLKKSTEPA